MPPAHSSGDKAQSAEGPGPSSGDSLPPHTHPQPQTLLQVKPCPTSLGGRSLPSLGNRVSGRPRRLGLGALTGCGQHFSAPHGPTTHPSKTPARPRQPPPHPPDSKGTGSPGQGQTAHSLLTSQQASLPPCRPGTGLGGRHAGYSPQPSRAALSAQHPGGTSPPQPHAKHPGERSPTLLGGAPAPRSGRKDRRETCREHGGAQGPRSAGSLAAGEALNSLPVKWGQPLPEGTENRTRPRRSAAGSTPCTVSTSPRVHPKAEVGSRQQATQPQAALRPQFPKALGVPGASLSQALQKGSLPVPRGRATPALPQPPCTESS